MDSGDQRSLFENDDPNPYYPINRTELNRAVCEHLRQPCLLKKLGEGSFHKVNFRVALNRLQHYLTLRKVYDIQVLRPRGPQLVVRVALYGKRQDGI
jgi:hypothetical protein